MMRQFELVEKVCSYDPGADEEALNRAYVYAMKMHGSQLRASGDSYFSHPIEVAAILTEYKLDCDSIITGILHDTIEDTPATLDQIRSLFGEDIARLVDGVTKLSRIELQSDQSKQAENFRKLVLAMSEDIRVLLVKLADRLHNMRTLSFIKNPDKRRRIALETMEIYAPLSERIGFSEIKNELEDLAFIELHSDVHQSLVSRLDYLRDQDVGLVDRILEQLRENLDKAHIAVKVSGREKTPFSIWRKMQSKNVAFEQLSDIMAFRVLVDNIEDCYRALGVIHSHYPMVPDRFKDYISTPKPNGYRSIHTGVFGPERHRIEIQIRTHEMHEVAELGVAAHWAYKQANPKVAGSEYRWLRELLDVMEHASNPEEFLEHTKMVMFQDQVFCFTPKGDLISLPKGACPVDFAYAVHSAVGDHCVGAKINGKMMPLRTPLTNGDQVQIITSKAQTPYPAWERFVVTGRARARIRRFMKIQQRSQFLDMGRAILKKAFKQEGYEPTEKNLESVIKIFKASTVEDLLILVGEGTLTGREVLTAVYPGLKENPKKEINLTPRKNKNLVTEQNPFRGLIQGIQTFYAGCCHPLPGDRIVGIVTTGKGVTIHTIDCEKLAQYAESPERWLDLSWNQTLDEMKKHIGRLSLMAQNEPNTIADITTIITKNKGEVVNLRTHNRKIDYLELEIDVDVNDIKHLTNIIAALRASAFITMVERTRN